MDYGVEFVYICREPVNRNYFVGKSENLNDNITVIVFKLSYLFGTHMQDLRLPRVKVSLR